MVYPIGGREGDDPEGWKFHAGYPPSYHAFGRMRAILAVQHALDLAPRRALEVAAGGGGLSASLAAAGCEVTANDLRPEPLSAMITDYTSGARIAVEGGNLFELSTERLGTFDLVIACEVIEHVAHPDDLLRQLKRFLAPGGRILLTTPNGLYFRNRLPSFAEAGDMASLEARQFKPDADGHLFLLTPQELCDLAQGAGLTVERLNLWGTPLVTGHGGCRVASGPASIAPAYYAERLTQRLPASWRARLCVAMSAILR